MRKKVFLRLSVACRLFLIIAFMVLIIFQIGCNGSTENKANEESTSPNKQTSQISNDWIALDINFKPNTNAEMRDESVRTIEKLLIDSVTVLRAGKYPDYYPYIKIDRGIFYDTLHYLLRLGNFPSGPPLTPPPNSLSASDTTNNPKCKCNVNCGVCQQLRGLIGDSSSTNSPYRNISSISFPGSEQ
jgi:hypothetical protein